MLKSVSLMLSYKTSYPARTLQNPVSLTVLAIISRTQRLSTGLNSIRNSSVCTFQTLPFQSFLPIDKFISLTHVSFNNKHNLSISSLSAVLFLSSYRTPVFLLFLFPNCCIIVYWDQPQFSHLPTPLILPFFLPLSCFLLPPNIFFLLSSRIQTHIFDLHTHTHTHTCPRTRAHTHVYLCLCLYKLVCTHTFNVTLSLFVMFKCLCVYSFQFCLVFSLPSSCISKSINRYL